VRFGLTLPIFDRLADPSLLADLAGEAEQAGWDGVFVWDHVLYRPPASAATDPWIAIAAMATRTERIRLGPMVTPLARRRPQVVARQLVALDHLSAGRIVFGVGLGLDTSGEEFVRFGEDLDLRRRGERLDEGLDVLTGLLSGEEVQHRGAHYTAAGVRFVPIPVRGRLPIWVAARWPNRRPLRRAARFDGVFIIDVTPGELAEAVEVVVAERPGALDGFEVVVHALADEADWPAMAAAGATWGLTTFDQFSVGPEEVRGVIARGPSG
jgi:alkanesulfonate monooxygenase SsuD/methylene tetrahydromethanopterin reductase-like flavin-dependent oxidoreductase (luciferase family)